MLNGHPMRNSAHICLGVCTYQRPQMLLRCLMSIRRLEEPVGVRLSVVVVENDAAPMNAMVISSFSRDDGPFHYVHEPRRGIAQARNAVLDKAAELGATWIVMLDDDQVVPSDWLFWMWHSARMEEADVVQTSVERILPAPLPAWAFPPKPTNRAWKVKAKWAPTNGVLFRAGLADKNGAPLRFNEEFALTGGEDRDFFLRAYFAGAKIVRTPEAVATEYVPTSKLTFSAQMKGAFSHEATNARQDRSYHGLPTLLPKTLKVLQLLLSGTGAFAVVPFAALISERAARKRLFRGCRQMARAAGIVAGLTGAARPEPYRNIHGG